MDRLFPGSETSSRDVDRISYARDLWPRHHLDVREGKVGTHRPRGIVWPKSTEEVARIVKTAGELRIPIVPFGAGSGVCAGVLPSEDTIVMDLKAMKRTRALHRDEPSVEVEAGAMGLPFEESMEREGFTLGHFPSSIGCSTVGGWVAARSAGQCSNRYGKIEDMVLALECVTGRGDIVTLHHRTHGPSLVPLVVGSEGTLAIITAATLRLHAAPKERTFMSYEFSTMKQGWEAMRALFQSGLRPAVSRLYDPFDAMLARKGPVRPSSHTSSIKGDAKKASKLPPGMGGAILRKLLMAPNALLTFSDTIGDHLFGPALLVLIFEGDEREATQARAILDKRGKFSGEGAAKRWLAHRYSVSYRQAPVFRMGLFSDTFEVAASWSNLERLYDSVRKAMSKHVFVMAHMSHAYPDGCCIYFSFAGTGKGSADGLVAGDSAWEHACRQTYDAAWRAGLEAATAAGGTIAHHHGIGRSKAPLLPREIPGISDAFHALKRTFDPHGILNPGSLEGTAPAQGRGP
jgi:alkyldihydroxyacetonephosphate synthase